MPRIRTAPTPVARPTTRPPARSRTAAIAARVLAFGAVLTAGGCASSAPAATTPSAAVPVPATSVPPTPVARAGFDSYAYPGDDALRVWRDASPYEWIGYYLPAPCHRETSWSGRRQAIADQGWGIAVLYVGQQTWEGVQEAAPPPAVAVDTTRLPAPVPVPVPVPVPDSAEPGAPTPPPACAPSQLTAERGATDGADAVGRTAAEGFVTGTVVYLDVERMERVPAAMRDYVRAWARQLATDGRFRPGLYAHLRNAAELHALMRETLTAAGRSADVPLWVASRTAADGTPFDVYRHDPSGVGLPTATIWQGMFDVRETWGGVTLRIDQNVMERVP